MYCHFVHKITHLGDRKVDLWIPNSLSPITPILIAHDGQNCFDGTLSLSGFGWELDKAAPLAAERTGQLEPLIVAPWNLEDKRIMEYTPEDILRSNPEWVKAYQSVTEIPYEPCGNAYIDWLVQELLPWTVKEFGFELHPNRTALLGSSLGALVSVTALSKYPEVFACALCVSTHWTIEDLDFAAACVRQLPKPTNHRLWFDHGDTGLEADYQPLQDYVDGLLIDAGWESHFVHKIYPGTDHTERDWRVRAVDVLSFWLEGIR